MAIETLHDITTTYSRILGRMRNGPTYAFGCAGRNPPPYDKDKSSTHQIGAKTLIGLFAGYRQRAGGTWSGHIFVTSCEEIETANNVRQLNTNRIKSKRVFPQL